MASGAGVLIDICRKGSYAQSFYGLFLCNLMLVLTLWNSLTCHVYFPALHLPLFLNFQVSTSFFSTYFSQLHLPKTTNLPLRDIISLPLPIYVILMQAKLPLINSVQFGGF